LIIFLRFSLQNNELFRSLCAYPHDPPMENDWKKRLGVVYSTDPDYEYDTGKAQQQQQHTPPPGGQILRVRIERSGRKGKTVTLIEGFRGNAEELKELGKELKTRCGTGGAIKSGEILLQGDFRDRARSLLAEKGYKVRPAGG
jgi:translation initiation factor 1